jgi:pyridoxal 5'-phosphate synthase pdxT subunit
LALQGAFALHIAALTRLGATAVEVRVPSHLDGLDAVVIPGGESTTISMLLERSGLFGPLAERLAGGLPALGTCAGMIMLADKVLDGRADQRCFHAIDIDVRRNGFGRQVDSFEADLAVVPFGEVPVHAVFIRAPVVERVGERVEVLAAIDGSPVICRQGPIVVTSFHPELGTDDRVHRLLLSAIDAGPGAAPQRPAARNPEVT